MGKVEIMFRVIETQTYTEPIEEWSSVGGWFWTESGAQAFMDIHYQTQVFSNEDTYNPATDCPCETCAGGWRAIDPMALVVQVVKI
jgi:hypothetical protein